MNRIAIIGLVTMTVISNAEARLWETRQQVDAQYGKPIHCEGDQNHGIVCTYNYQRFHVVVTFLNDRGHSELFYRSDNKYLVPIEVLKLIQMNVREGYM